MSDLAKGALKPEEIDHLIEDAVLALKQQVDHSVTQSAPEKAPIGFASLASESTPVDGGKIVPILSNALSQFSFDYLGGLFDFDIN